MWTSIDWIMNSKLVLEILYYFATFFLVVVGFLALKQIKLTKNLSIISSKRESFRLAAEQCKLFDSEIVPLCRAIDKKIKNNNIDFFKKSKVEIKGPKVKISPCKDDAEIQKLDLVGLDILDMCNKIDAFAMYFTSGIADERIAYYTLGEGYCEVIEEFLAFILPQFDPPQHFVALFFKWRARREAERAKMKKENLKKELEQVEFQEKEYSEQSKAVKPLGTE